MSRDNHRNRKGLFSSKSAGANMIDQSIDVRAEAMRNRLLRGPVRAPPAIRHRCAAYSEQHAQ